MTGDAPPDKPPTAAIPTSLDAILASIRARVTETVAADADDAPAADPAAALPAPADVVLAAIPPGAVTVDALLRQMLEPQVKAWLDAHLPEMVERLVREDIRRITGQP
jgi:cell pole-organizing protein PopZ